MSHLADIVRNTRLSALALGRAQTWKNAAFFAEQDMITAQRKGDIAAARQFFNDMLRALRLYEQNMRRHETLRATLGT